jgi:hypothetical protein
MVIEDKLQDGEPDMIHKLQMAGIKVLYFVVIAISHEAYKLPLRFGH